MNRRDFIKLSAALLFGLGALGQVEPATTEPTTDIFSTEFMIKMGEDLVKGIGEVLNSDLRPYWPMEHYNCKCFGYGGTINPVEALGEYKINPDDYLDEWMADLEAAPPQAYDDIV